MLVKWLFAAAMVVVYVGCDFRETGNGGEINKIQSGNREYTVFWERCGNKNQNICVKVKYKISGLVKKEFDVAGYDDFAVPQFTMHLDESNNRITVVDPSGIKFEFQCE